MTGSGTPSDPYVIYDVDDLQAINTYGYEDVWYELANDIDASATSGWNGGKGFLPIGGDDGVWGLHLDGKGFIIDGIYINRDADEEAFDDLGFFTASWESPTDMWNKISNINFMNMTVIGTGNYYTAGCLGGSLWDMVMEYVNVEGSLTVEGVTGGGGGICGHAGIGPWHDCEFIGDITITSHLADNIGGFAGRIYGSGYTPDPAWEIWRCYAIIDMDLSSNQLSWQDFGGFAGNFGWGDSGEDWPYIHDCFARGIIRLNSPDSGWDGNGFTYMAGGRGRDCYAAVDQITDTPWQTLIVTTVEQGDVVCRQGWPHVRDGGIRDDGYDGLHPSDYAYDIYPSAATTWANARNGTGEILGDVGHNDMRLGASKLVSLYSIRRGYVFFDTRPLDGLTITAAKIRFMVSDWYEADAGYATIHVVEGVASIPPEHADFLAHRDKVTSFGSLARIGEYDDDPQWVEIVLNATGRSFINQTGVTQFCLRLAADVNDTAPTGNNATVVWSNFERSCGLDSENSIINGFWDGEVSGYNYNLNWAYEGQNGFPETTENMKKASTFTDKGWDFAGTWFIDEDINDGYPFFKPFAELAGPIWM